MREGLTLTMQDQQRIEVLARWVAGAVTPAEAAALLGRSERTAWRLRARFLAEGVAGLVHGNRGRPSPRRVPAGTAERIVALVRERYRGANDCHLAELLATEEGIVVGRSTLRRLLREAGIPSPRRRRAPRYRSRRARMAQAGLLVQLDGSPHDWLEDRGPRLTLLGAIDDATGLVVAAVFRDHEDGAGYLELLAALCARHGIPAAVYRDHSGIFASNPPERRSREDATQVGRAFAELGIVSIAASSPQAKGRIERLWETLQDRLVIALRLAGACDRERANAVLAGFLPAFNARFGVPAALEPPAWRPVPPTLDLARVCAFRYRRVVGNDNTVRLEGAVLQLPPALRGRSLAGRRVELELRLDGRLLVVLEGHTLLAVPAPPDPARLRDIRFAAPHGPAPVRAPDRPGYPPPATHPWRRPGPKAPSRLTESLSR